MSERPAVSDVSMIWRLALLLMLGLATRGSARADDSVSATRVINHSSSTVTVYWIAWGCLGIEGDHVTVCHSQSLGAGQSGTYSWLWGQTGKSVGASCAGTTTWVAEAEMSLCGDDGSHLTRPRPSFKVLHKASGLCLDPADVDGAEGRPVGLFRCDEGLDQTFYYSIDGLGGTTKTAASDRCLDVPSAAAGQHVLIWGCDGGEDQAWHLIAPAGTGWGRLENMAGMDSPGHLCLEAVPGSQARLATCDGSDKQTWMFVYYPR